MDFASKTENATANLAIVVKQPQGDQTMPKGCESRNGFGIARKAISAKGNYIVCEECAEERERDEGPSAFHCCPCDPVVVGFRTKAGPISRPKSHCGSSDQVMVTELRTNPNPNATDGWTPWDWSSLCVHARLGMPTCGCSNGLRNNVRSIKKPY